MALRQDILQGRLPANARLPTERELCERFDASRNTVRKAVHRLAIEGLVSTREKAGSHVNAPTAEASANVLSLMYSGDMALLTTIQDAVMNHGCLLSLYSQRRTHWDTEREAAFLDQVLAQRHRALLAFCSPLPPRNDDRLDRLQAAGVRVVHVEPYTLELPRHNFLMPDYARAGYLAATTLLMAGCRRILYVGISTDGPALQLTARGVADALRDHLGPAAKFADAYIEQPIMLTPEDLAWLAAQIQGPCGVVCGSHSRARTVLQAFSQVRGGLPPEVRIAAVEENGDVGSLGDAVDHILFDRKALYERLVDMLCRPEFVGVRELVSPRLVRAGG